MSGLLLLLPTRGGCLAFNDAQHFFLAHDEVLFVVHLNFSTGILTEEDAIPRFHIQRYNFPVLSFRTSANSNYFAFLRLLLGRIGNDEAALHRLLLFNSLDQNPIVERSKIHLESPFTYKFSIAFKPRCTASESRNSEGPRCACRFVPEWQR